MLTHHDRGGFGIARHDFLHREAEFKTWPHPRHIFHRAAENFLGELLTIRRGRNRDDCVGVHVVHELCGNKTVQRRVNGRRARIEIERRVIVGGDHVVLGLRLQTFVAARSVRFLHAEQFRLIERGKIFAQAGAQVAAGTFDPEHFDIFTSQGIFLHELGGSVATAGVGDALVAAEFIGAVNKAIHPRKLHRFSFCPQV